MSIKPQYANLIKAGEKTVELRKVIPKLTGDDILVIYESSPVKKVTAYCEIDRVSEMNPEELWYAIGEDAKVSRAFFESYFKERERAFGIHLKNVYMLNSPMDLYQIQNGLTAPQNFRYLTKEQFDIIKNQ